LSTTGLQSIATLNFLSDTET